MVMTWFVGPQFFSPVKNFPLLVKMRQAMPNPMPTVRKELTQVPLLK
jgi:hypothetical protein